MEALDSLGEPNINDVEEEEEEEVHYASGPASKLQPRAVVSKARWNDEMGMAQVVVQKGTFSKSTGIVRSGNLYYSIEEVLFLVEIGALVLLDESDTGLSLEDVYVNMSGGKYGCCWEEFRAYRQLKSLGYIVGRYGIPWSMKKAKSNCESISSQGCPDSDEAVNLESEEIRSVIGLFNEMQINEARPVFNVYLPNSKFRKSSPGDPCFVLCFTSFMQTYEANSFAKVLQSSSKRGYPPSRAELEALEGQCRSIPLKFCNVEQGRVSFFSFDKVELPILD
ncbi:putative tRNA-splicing endonuclease, subunit Sen54 [Rosa chinensis]|uniref:Putative tRNA-splicing endonuclease, subunit Sen54 n=1 Tax=Rosa chinensis TaxID=74649 RepID=A0A2P6REE9_ROSCH|nr:uncharacterized protein LOC112195452 isoform X1 [Rosa chinensis]PRQ44812.1 putative tRNA-splicing endonuclease, subunit Sen54 [Rosa chinensis]